jgi:hypothetical protein
LGLSDLEISKKVAELMAKAREESLEKGANLNSKRNNRAGF